MKSFYNEFKDLKQRSINEAFINACKNNELDKVKYLLNSSELRYNANPHYQNELCLNFAFANSSIELIKYLSSPKNFRKPLNTNQYMRGFLLLGVKKNDIEWVEELLHDIVKNDLYAFELVLNESCENGNLPLFKHLLESPVWGDEKFINNELFCVAAKGGNVELIKYFLNPKWNNKIDIHYEQDLPFICACDAEELDAVNYFIFDLNIPKSEHIIRYFDDMSDEFSEKVNKIFDSRDLAKSLNNELESDKSATKKLKV